MTSALSASTVVAVLLSVGACAHPAPTIQPAPSTSSSRGLPNDIRWFRASAEYRALARQAYAVAGERIPELARGLVPQSWTVVLDADETVLDNSEYQRRRAVLDSSYTEPSWAKWVNERAAPAVPGAPELTRKVHALGGRIAIVTNRADSLCAVTRANLQSVGIEADMVLCQPPGEADKNPRFGRIQNGSAVPGVPPLRIVAWFGDNILDFPNLSQAVRNDPRALDDFGRRFFILPNPMYGSWQQVREP
jgi:5'-nucleotidase (lipoprotein e(P4) family)